MTCIETDNLSVSFDSRIVWKGLTLHIERGRRVRIAGPSGCGKSTLLKCFMGFVPTFSGVIRIDQQQLNAQSVWELRRKLAYLAQEPDLGTGRVLARLQEPFVYRRNAGIRFDRDRLYRWLEYYLLPGEILDKDISTLSGGEKQPLAVILAILLDRTIFLLDEPVSAMDQQSRQRFIEMFHAHSDWTVLFISHYKSLAELADETIDLSGWKGDAQ